MEAKAERARLVAFYLPQYHPIPENDAWWCKGFTEWTNSASAKPLFPGHYQPHVPADLGFYDLRVPETREAQAEMARRYGIEAFCYYHYWFSGRRLLERPFTEVLRSGRPDFPFCLCWANQTWSGVWHGASDRILVEQTYPGEDDHRAHFTALLPALRDKRYLLVDGKPLFLVYSPQDIPEPRNMLHLWRKLAINAGLKGLYLLAASWDATWDARQLGYDGTVLHPPLQRRRWYPWSSPLRKIKTRLERKLGLPTIRSYARMLPGMLPRRLPNADTLPTVIPNWDNTPRSGADGLVLHGSTPALFRQHFRHALALVRELPVERRLVFIKSWNEWAEGNHLEPDLRYGTGYLEVLCEESQRVQLGILDHPHIATKPQADSGWPMQSAQHVIAALSRRGRPPL
jgi:lipopolysaccharide biosynthesis protein